MSHTKLTPEQKQARKEERIELKKLAAENARIEAEKNQKPVSEIHLSIEWKKSRTWGRNPMLTAKIKFQDGSWERANATCSGCGYDKESTVIADIFNRYLKYTLHNDLPNMKNPSSIDNNGVPYGVYISKYKRFEGGIGIECYYSISEYIGGKFEKVASGQTFDAYKFTMINS